jgi:hypothetical protein
MKIIELNDWDLSYHGYADWCRENKIGVNRISLTKYRLKDEDFVFFKLKFSKSPIKQSVTEELW